MEASGLSASDIALLGNGTTGNEFIWIFALLLLFGGNGFGFNRNATNDAMQNEILSGQKFDALTRQVNAIGDGISSLGYSQIQQMDNNTASIKEAVHAEGEATRGMIAQNKIESLQAQVNQLQMQQNIQNAMCGVPKINPYLYGITQNSCSCYNG